MVSLGLWTDWVKSISEDLHGPLFLELGHGPGYLQQTLLNKGCATFGIDRSPQMGKLALKRLRKSPLQPRLVNSDARHLPFPDCSFDQIAATFPTEYIIEEMTIKEIDRVLKPGGELFILPTARLTGTDILHRFIAWLYAITGQTGMSAEEYFQQGLCLYEKAGFTIKYEQCYLGNSELLVINITKPIR